MSRRNPRRGGALVEIVHRHRASFAIDAQRKHFVCGRAHPQYAGADDQIETAHAGLLVLPAGKHAIGVVRLDPALQEAGRNRQSHRLAVDAFELHPGKPA
jgi:hypothetical protein